MSAPRKLEGQNRLGEGDSPHFFSTSNAALPLAAKMGTVPGDFDRWILAARPPKSVVDPWRPYHYLVEPEFTRSRRVEDTGTIFLTNRECPFRCVMCDLWKNTTDESVPGEAILTQIEWALERMAPARHLKLYNSGNFFDPHAVPPAELPRIADRLAALETMIVECHPCLIGRRCFEFHERLRPALDVAMGLETANPDVLRRLNKRMTLADFAHAADQLRRRGIAVRAFILLRPPFLDEAEGLLWAKRSLDFAWDAGVECCVLIPTRGGNGAMERLATEGFFSPPRLESLEAAVEYGLERRAGRVFADLWDIERLFRCQSCGPTRAQRLQAMNLSQTIPPPIECADCATL